MSSNHPLETFVQKVEKAFEAVENPELLAYLKNDPDVSCLETEEEFKLSFNLHDINPDAVELTWQNGQIIFSTQEGEYTPFTYQLAIPSNVDPFSVAMDFVDDTLEIQFSKATHVSKAAV